MSERRCYTVVLLTQSQMLINGLQGTPVDLDGQHVDDDKVMPAPPGRMVFKPGASTLPSRLIR